jgi:diguanylate cyclase (GGDEF)-like protein
MRLPWARVGGEEFALLLTDVMRADAFAFAEKLRRSIAGQPVKWAGANATITMSIGFAATPSWQGPVSPLVARADAALYEAKRAGRNRVVLARDYLVNVA